MISIPSSRHLRLLFVVVVLVVHMAMLVLAWPRNPGTVLPLAAFGTSAALMAMAIGYARNYTALCLGLFLWLGLWLKFVAHLYFAGALVEPIGNFDGSAGQYDALMQAAAVGCLAAAAAFLAGPHLRLTSISLHRELPAPWPSFNPIQLVVYAGLLLLCLIIGVLNIHLGIFQVGIAPRTILPRPGNALISLFISTGYFLAIAYFVYCDRSKSRALLPGLVTLIICAGIMSSSLLSRGVVVFHLLAVILALTEVTLRQATSRAFVVFACSVIMCGGVFFFTVGYVQDGRTISFAQPLPGSYGVEVAELEPAAVDLELAAGDPNKIVAIIGQLAVGRWIGLEGVMVAAANRNNSPDLMATMLTERGAVGEDALYQYLSKSHYVDINDEKFQFATLPGPVAAFLFGGSVGYVFVGIFALSLLAMAFEKLSQRLSRSVFVTCFVAVSGASFVSQFGLTPVNQVPQIIYILIVLVLFWGVRLMAPRLATTPLRHVLPT